MSNPREPISPEKNQEIFQEIFKQLNLGEDDITRFNTFLQRDLSEKTKLSGMRYAIDMFYKIEHEIITDPERLKNLGSAMDAAMNIIEQCTVTDLIKALKALSDNTPKMSTQIRISTKHPDDQDEKGTNIHDKDIYLTNDLNKIQEEFTKFANEDKENTSKYGSELKTESDGSTVLILTFPDNATADKFISKMLKDGLMRKAEPEELAKLARNKVPTPDKPLTNDSTAAASQPITRSSAASISTAPPSSPSTTEQPESSPSTRMGHHP